MAYSEAEVPKLLGKTALVTGANTGIGFHTARVLAERGAHVLLGCRDQQKANLAIQTILKIAPEAELDWVPLDLASLRSIGDAAETVQRKHSSLDLLINNAGVMVPPRTKTEDGFELQFGVNHLGHFALTGRLVPLMARQDGARIVNVSSLAHRGGVIDFDDLHADKHYSRMKRYQMSKLANLFHTRSLNQKLLEAGLPVRALASHPGGSNTELGRHLGLLRVLFLPLELLMNSASEGALPTLRAATDALAVGGGYYGPAGFGEFARGARAVAVDPRVENLAIAERLWKTSEELTGIAYHF
ncbi:MAG: SDR family NAD(P)-dependent oxidoreductase [Actinobacteria bacterium]|nr:SDR family NAD(P)-dependent oxidoreductase [Actinomycetota bacterium]